MASSVLGIVSQRLVRRICQACAAPYEPTPEEMAFYKEAGGAGKTTFVRGTGLPYLRHTGYLDRIGVYEFLHMTPEIRRLLVGWATQDELRRVAINQGMRTLRPRAWPRRRRRHHHLRSHPKYLRAVRR